MIQPKQIEGWMGKHSRRWLREQARRADRIIEVGVWKGRSTLVLARATRGTVWAVDTWAGTPADAEQHERLYAEGVEGGDVYGDFCRNLNPYIRAGRVVPVRMDSREAAAALLEKHGRAFDLVFIDADHSYEGARGDIEAFRPLIRPGGILSGHDYHWPGVERAVNELLTGVALGPKSIWSVRL